MRTVKASISQSVGHKTPAVKSTLPQVQNVTPDPTPALRENFWKFLGRWTFLKENSPK